MLREVGSFLSSEGLATGLIILLSIILYDDKALQRLEKSKIGKYMYIPIIIYFFLLVLDVIKIIMKYSN